MVDVVAVVVEERELVAVEISEPGPPGPPGPAAPVGGISADPDNRLATGTDGGLYVRDDLVPDPLAYYILAKG